MLSVSKESCYGFILVIALGLWGIDTLHSLEMCGVKSGEGWEIIFNGEGLPA